jgi:hypothetical protein
MINPLNILRRCAVIASIVLAMGFTLCLTLIAPTTQKAYAGGLCSLLYVVQSGDTTEAVANRFQLDPNQLIVVVRGRMLSVARLRACQLLCVPNTGYVSSFTGNIALESIFIYPSNLDEQEWNLSKDQGYLGQRLALPLEAEGIKVFTQTSDFLNTVSATLSAGNVPVMAGRINPFLRNEYTLVVLEADDLLQSVHFTVTTPVTWPQGVPIDIASVLATTDVVTTTFTVWLELPGTARYPFQVKDIVFAPTDAEIFRREYLETEPRRLTFVVFRSSVNPSQYYVYVLTTTGSQGPGGGSSRYELCRVISYRGFWGWFRRWYC